MKKFIMPESFYKKWHYNKGVDWESQTPFSF
jgi:hypothetical protein